MWRVARPQALLLLLTLLTFVQPASAFPQRGVPPGLCRLLEMVQVAFVRRAGNGRCIPTDPESALRALARNPVESVVRYLWRRPLGLGLGLGLFCYRLFCCGEVELGAWVVSIGLGLASVSRWLVALSGTEAATGESFEARGLGW